MNLTDLIKNQEDFFSPIKFDWNNASNTFPDFFETIPPSTRQCNEEYILASTDKIKNQFKRFHALPFMKHPWKKRTLQLIQDFLEQENIFHVHRYLSGKAMDAFSDEMKQFIRAVRKFAPELSFGDMGQAARNYIVYAMFKEMHNEKSDFNLAAFGYSMMYPFSDNYIDNKANSPLDKERYNQLIYDQIKGLCPHSPILHYQKTCELINAIETVYPRDQDTDIYHLLLMMLDAQKQSIHQQNKSLPLTPSQRLDISVYKGGISVLIDRYFVKKELTKRDISFYLGFGFFLQLADDLQDIGEDYEKGHSTLFTIDINPTSLEKLVNKILHFLHHLMVGYQPDNIKFKEFILSSSYFLIFSAVIGSKEFFSDHYINTIQQYLPVSSTFLTNYNKLENMDLKTHVNYRKRFDELLL